MSQPTASPSVTDTARMRAARIHAFGGPEELRVEEVAAPTPGPGEVLVQVRAAGLNPLDYKMRDGSSGKAKMLELPAILGREMSGTVLSAAEDVDLAALGMPVGSPVFGVRALDDPRGTYAEVVAIPAAELAPVPEAALAECAGGADPLLRFGGLALAGVTALVSIEDAAITPGATVLIHGGTGGVGQLLIPLALAAGAGQVWATGRAENAARITELGATPIPYDEADWEAVIDEATGGRGVDVILDTHYFETFEPSLDHLAEGGRIVVLPSLADLTPARERGITASIPVLAPSRERLDRLAEGVAAGTLPLEVGEVLALEEVAHGHAQLETGHTRGKIVLAL